MAERFNRTSFLRLGFEVFRKYARSRGPIGFIVTLPPLRVRIFMFLSMAVLDLLALGVIMKCATTRILQRQQINLLFPLQRKFRRSLRIKRSSALAEMKAECNMFQKVFTDKVVGWYFSLRCMMPQVLQPEIDKHFV